MHTMKLPKFHCTSCEVWTLKAKMAPKVCWASWSAHRAASFELWTLQFERVQRANLSCFTWMGSWDIKRSMDDESWEDFFGGIIAYLHAWIRKAGAHILSDLHICIYRTNLHAIAYSRTTTLDYSLAATTELDSSSYRNGMEGSGRGKNWEAISTKTKTLLVLDLLHLGSLAWIDCTLQFLHGGSCSPDRS